MHSRRRGSRIWQANRNDADTAALVFDDSREMVEHAAHEIGASGTKPR
jgi:hypothetical protein